MSTDARPTRDAHGHFLPGYTPNPGGRPHASVSIVKTFQKRLAEHPEIADQLINSALKLANKPDAPTINMLKEWVDGKTASEVVLKGVIAHIGNEYAQTGLEWNQKDLESRRARYGMVDAEVRELSEMPPEALGLDSSPLDGESNDNPLLETIARLKLGTNNLT